MSEPKSNKLADQVNKWKAKPIANLSNKQRYIIALFDIGESPNLHLTLKGLIDRYNSNHPEILNQLGIKHDFDLESAKQSVNPEFNKELEVPCLQSDNLHCELEKKSIEPEPVRLVETLAEKPIDERLNALEESVSKLISIVGDLIHFKSAKVTISIVTDKNA